MPKLSSAKVLREVVLVSSNSSGSSTTDSDPEFAKLDEFLDSQPLAWQNPGRKIYFMPEANLDDLPFQGEDAPNQTETPTAPPPPTTPISARTPSTGPTPMLETPKAAHQRETTIPIPEDLGISPKPSSASPKPSPIVVKETTPPVVKDVSSSSQAKSVSRVSSDRLEALLEEDPESLFQNFLDDNLVISSPKKDTEAVEQQDQVFIKIKEDLAKLKAKIYDAAFLDNFCTDQGVVDDVKALFSTIFVQQLNEK